MLVQHIENSLGRPGFIRRHGDTLVGSCRQHERLNMCTRKIADIYVRTDKVISFCLFCGFAGAIEKTVDELRGTLLDLGGGLDRRVNRPEDRDGKKRREVEVRLLGLDEVPGCTLREDFCGVVAENDILG
jgi:hypothetical protein